MKNTNVFKSLLLTLIVAMLPQIVFAANLCVDGLYYNFVGHTTNRTVELTYQTYQYGYPAYPNLFGNLIIPDIVSESNTDYKVIKINEYALQYCSRLTSVTIGNNVTEIGHDAFLHCSGLTSITIPNSVTTIGSSAFSGCTGLTGELNIPNSVTSIGYRAFKGCSGLTSLIIGYSVNKIDYGTFQGCTGLTSLIIGSSVTEISDGGIEPSSMPFNECTGLTSISVDSNNPKYDSRDNCNAIIETLTNSLFLGCKNTIIPNTVTSIGKVAFLNCTGLTSITIPNSVTSIGNLAFSRCTGLTSVVCLIPTPLPINEAAFRDVYENADLYVLPESVNAYKSTYPWSKFNVLSVDDYVLATGISLNKTSTSLSVGETETLVATVTPSNATYKKVSWKSNNTSVATVDQNGTVTAKATGTAYITATTIDGTNLSATCKVTVTPATVLATGISLNKTSTSLTVGATETLVATVTPSNATNNAVSWESNNTSVATVDQNGKVTAKAAGTANITATTTDGTNLSATCQVTVIQMGEILIGNGTVQDEVVPIVNWEMGSYIGSECLYVKNQLAGLKAGDKIRSIAFYLMSGSAKGGNFNVRMKNTSIYSLKNNADTYDTSCIEVNYNDQVNGNVTLGPYSGGQWIYFPLSTPFVYNGGNIIIDIRNTTPGTRAGGCYFATTTYNGVVRRSLAWHHANSENPHVDGFPEEGGIYDFGNSNSSNLPNIKIAYTSSGVLATGISLNKTSTSLTVGATETLVATVTPSNATNKNVTWSSSNTSVATVDQNGKVTAKTVGTANITATTTDGTNLTATCQVTVTSPAQPEENTITIGNGTVANEGVPIVNWQMGSYIGSECLYLKDQLTGLKAGDKITSISFYLMSGSAKGGNFNVRMKNTSISSLKNNADTYDTSCIEVNYNDQVNGNVTLDPYSGGQWIYFPLSTPFVYNGGNIIIDIRNTTPGTRVGWCYFATTTYNGVRRSLTWHHANSENPHVDGFNDGGIYDYENRSDLPNIKITYTAGNVYATGDVNGDGHVSSVDVTALYNYLLNGDDSNLVNGDVDGDGHISSVDVTAVYNVLLGN